MIKVPVLSNAVFIQRLWIIFDICAGLSSRGEGIKRDGGSTWAQSRAAAAMAHADGPFAFPISVLPAAVRSTRVYALPPAEIEDGDNKEGCFSPERNSETPITNLYPAHVLEGTSGVYLLAHKDTGAGVAVFKPFDEENFPQEASSWAVSNGTGYYRERAAYVVSDQVLEGISEVPKTVIATVKFEGWPKGEKRGSLQVFVPNAGDMSDRGPANIPVEEVQKVGILDILVFNMDRHEGNLLLQGACNSLSLVPIDHGLCLPEIIAAESGPNHELLKSIYFVWQNWPQAKQPISDALRRLLDRQLANDFVRQVVGQLRKDLDRHTITCAALTTLKIGALVLKHGVGVGLTLSEIATLVRTKLPEILQRSWEKAGKLIITTKVREPQPDCCAEDVAKVASTAVVPLGRAQAGAEEEAYLFWEAALLSYLEALLRAEFSSDMGKSAREDKPRESQNGSACKNGSTGGLFRTRGAGAGCAGGAAKYLSRSHARQQRCMHTCGRSCKHTSKHTCGDLPPGVRSKGSCRRRRRRGSRGSRGGGIRAASEGKGLGKGGACCHSRDRSHSH